MFSRELFYLGWSGVASLRREAGRPALRRGQSASALPDAHSDVSSKCARCVEGAGRLPSWDGVSRARLGGEHLGVVSTPMLGGTFRAFLAAPATAPRTGPSLTPLAMPLRPLGSALGAPEGHAHVWAPQSLRSERLCGDMQRCAGGGGGAPWWRRLFAGGGSCAVSLPRPLGRAKVRPGAPPAARLLRGSGVDAFEGRGGSHRLCPGPPRFARRGKRGCRPLLGRRAQTAHGALAASASCALVALFSV